MIVPTLASLQKKWPHDNLVPWDAALTFAVICKASYESPASGSLSFAGMQFDKIDSLDLGSSSIVVGSDKESIIVAFRGTDDKFDVAIDLLFIKHTNESGDFHFGFYTAMKMLYSKVVELIDRHSPSHKKLYLTGHSLGGALAILFAYEVLKKKAFDIESVVTFGQPLTFCSSIGADVCNNLKGSYVRFVNVLDIVTKVPPVYYAHDGSSITFEGGQFQPKWRKRESDEMAYAMLSNQGSLSKEDFELAQEEFRRRNSDEPKLMRSSSLELPGWLQYLIDAIKKEHSMENYIELIQKQAR